MKKLCKQVMHIKSIYAYIRAKEDFSTKTNSLIKFYFTYFVHIKVLLKCNSFLL